MQITQIILYSYIFSIIYILSSIPLTLSYRTTRVFNFAHPVFITYGAYIAIFASKLLGDAFLTIIAPLAFATGGIIALINHLLVLKPLARQKVSSNIYMIATMGLWFIYQYILYSICQILSRTYGENFLSYPTIIFKDISYLQSVLGLRNIPQYLITFTLIGCIVLVLLYFIFNKTILGLALKAVADNEMLASVCGIPYDKLVYLMWFLVGGITALSGMLWVNFSGSTTPDIGLYIVVDDFAAAFIGGLYSLTVTGLASILLASVENILTSFLNYYFGMSPTIRIAIVFGVIFTVLVIKPPLGAGGGLPYRFLKKRRSVKS